MNAGSANYRSPILNARPFRFRIAWVNASEQDEASANRTVGMSEDDFTLRSWLKATAGALARFALYPVVIVLLYSLSQGPAAYFHNRNVLAGGKGYARVMQRVYHPMGWIQNRLPFYHEYMRWWCEP